MLWGGECVWRTTSFVDTATSALTVSSLLRLATVCMLQYQALVLGWQYQALVLGWPGEKYYYWKISRLVSLKLL